MRSYLFRSIASEIVHDCIILSGERGCDARDCFKSWTVNHSAVRLLFLFFRHYFLASEWVRNGFSLRHSEIRSWFYARKDTLNAQ